MGSRVEAKAIANELVAQLENNEEIEVGSLFGGAGLRADGVVFASVIDEVVYLVVDAEMKQELEALGSSPFSYDKADRRVTVAKWYEAPAVVFEDPDALADWVSRARTASLIAAAAAGPKKPRKPKSPPPV